MPVPYVAFASPGAKQPWPKSAACWSPAIPATGSVTPRNDASAATPDEATTSGSTARSTPNSGEQLVVPLARREIEQHRPRRVRHVGDVRRPRPSASTRATNRSSRRRAPTAAARRAPGSTRASSPRSTGPGRARCARGSALPAAPRSARRCAGPARRSRDAPAVPVRRSQTTVVSRWFVIPIASSSLAATPAAASASAAVCSTLAQISSGSCSTQPGSGKCCRISRYPRPSTRSSGSTTRHVVPVVPWSIARITAVVDQHGGRPCVSRTSARRSSSAARVRGRRRDRRGWRDGSGRARGIRSRCTR